jgi:hypothetical protein
MALDMLLSATQLQSEKKNARCGSPAGRGKWRGVLTGEKRLARGNGFRGWRLSELGTACNTKIYIYIYRKRLRS